MQGKMKTFIKDTEAEKEGDKVNVIFLILASLVFLENLVLEQEMGF